MIFYADDDHDDISFFKDVASELDIPVTVFNAGSHLLEKLNAPPPAPTIIFLDINMPGHSGIEILKTIRKSDQWRNVPVIMLSTSSNLQDINTSYEYGATYYLPKVGNYGKLSKAIKRIVETEWQGNRPAMQNFVYSYVDEN